MISLVKPLFWEDPDMNSHHLSMRLIGWFLRLVLLPIAGLYWLAGCIRFICTKSYKASMPVICVGNITIGGSGKTPVCAMLYDYLKQAPHYHQPVILMRGYGGQKGVKKPLLVDPKLHIAEEVGDEALMMAKRGFHVVICRDRAAGAQFIEQHDNHFSIIIMDDGLQNPSLHQDIKLCVVDGTYGFGNRWIFPSGPCRGFIKPALKRCDSILSIGKNSLNTHYDNVIEMNFRAHEDDVKRFKKHEYVAFAGIGNPSKFFNTLRQYDIPVLEEAPFPDHHAYSEQDIQSLIERAKAKDARLITTGKDAVKIVQYGEMISPYLDILPVSLHLDNNARQAIDHMLDDKGLRVPSEKR